MKLYNTLSRTLETIDPLSDNNIKLYTCGLTVYSQPQIGNWVAYIYSDVLNRVLLACGFNVTRVQNITDVGHLVSDDDSGEDKLQKGAKKEGTTAWEIAKKYSQLADKEAYSQLGLLRPTKIVSATSQIDKQIEFAKALEQKGYTYVIDGEGVYFDTSKVEDYGKLARLDVEGLEAGARVPVEGKRNITDFAIWKFSPKDSKRDMEWQSPWGAGFPGWHLECSSIILSELGEQIDIHSGGIDHIPVHHTNEIAQSEALTGKQLSRLWFHNNFMLINGEKMAKSTGNSYTLDDVLKKGYSTDAFKLLVISSHYRTAGNFTWVILDSAQNRLINWRNTVSLRWQEVAMGSEATKSMSSPKDDLLEILSNDLDTPSAVSYIDKYLSEASKLSDTTLRKKRLDEMSEVVNSLLGINLSGEDISDAQKRTLRDRNTARKQKEWTKADELRFKLEEEGITVKDFEEYSVWSRDLSS